MCFLVRKKKSQYCLYYGLKRLSTDVSRQLHLHLFGIALFFFLVFGWIFARSAGGGAVQWNIVDEGLSLLDAALQLAQRCTRNSQI